MKLICLLPSLVLTFTSVVSAFPAYGSLAGLSIEERDHIVSTLQVRHAEPPPGPLYDTSAKLVNDEDHPWQPLRPGDIRGPCPGLNTLASHGVRLAWKTFSFHPNLLLFSGFRAMALLPLHKLLMQSKKVTCNSILWYESSWLVYY